ncbi:SUMF1/EgtB/PvdO family nonheme iron enzyme [Cloacibacterium sp. Arc13]|uniref:formylglycine-generating enzyme family protein n=1 Tax=unclassified Cloacibacterium TaxID=2620870 RepID=UPI00352ECDA7
MKKFKISLLMLAFPMFHIITSSFKLHDINLEDNLYNVDKIPEMIYVEGGVFKMGIESKSSDNFPVRNIKLNSFSISKYEITVKQFRVFCQETNRDFPKARAWDHIWEDEKPMVYITYDDALSYCKWLEKKIGGICRLPTEAEWEYAAKGGNKSKNYKYSGSDDINKVAWISGNMPGLYNELQPVGKKEPNELGIYDMSGNVFEWCSDWYYCNYLDSQIDNPKGPSSGFWRVIRGGSIEQKAKDCLITDRQIANPKNIDSVLGFRVVQLK